MLLKYLRAASTPELVRDFAAHRTVVAYISVAIDFTHPDLGGGIGPGFKIIGGFDFVGDNFTGK